MKGSGFILFAMVGGLAAPGVCAGQQRAEGVRFTDRAAASGIEVHTRSGSPAQNHIVDTAPGGVAFFDSDNDGDLDLYITNGSSFEPQPGPAPRNRLYRNRRGDFEDITAAAGVGDTSWSMGCAVADFDNDGDSDLHITNFGANSLYRNNGKGSFDQVAAQAGVAAGQWSTGSTFGDYDLDGDVDLYVANYIWYELDYQSPIPCVWRGVDVFCGPQGQRPQANILYQNLGDGRFADASIGAGVGQRKHFSYDAVFSDYDNDGWPDLFVANDQGPNYLYRNQGDGTFVDMALLAGTAYSGSGGVQGCMGVAVGDYDANGLQDYLVTNFTDEHNALYRNEADGFFADVSFGSRVGAHGEPFSAWGATFFDMDNDADLDLFIANGHIYPAADFPPLNLGYAERNFLFENRDGEVFEEVGAAAGLESVAVSRGVAAGDYDNDGDLDLLVYNLNGRPNLLRNEGGNRNNWLQVRTLGSRSNRDGIGARLLLEAGGRRQWAEVRSGGGYLSHSALGQHFGLGAADTADRLEVRWPGGAVQVLEGVAANQLLVVREPPH